jgi:CheY-like chemotaxis protein
MADAPRICVLLVDDHDDTLAALRRLLSYNGYAVEAAHTADEAMRLAAANKCDLLISDIGLPPQDGLELMRQLKRQYGLRGIAVSGYAAESDVSAALAAGFDRHLAKPVELAKLMSAIKELVG